MSAACTSAACQAPGELPVDVPARCRCWWFDASVPNIGLVLNAASLAQPDPAPCQRSWSRRRGLEASCGAGELGSQDRSGLWLQLGMGLNVEQRQS